MKKSICVILCLLLIISVSGCSSAPQKIREPVTYYYRIRNIEYDAPNGIICAEVREAYGNANNYTYLVEQYLRGPLDGSYTSPFPAGTTLVHLDFLKDTVLVVLSSHISLLSGSDLSIASTCLAKTVLEMTGMKEVKISSQGDLLNGQESITISLNDFVMVDDYVLTGVND